MSRNLYFYAAVCALILMCVEVAFAQSLDTPQTRMRPIGSGSAVDQYRGPTSNLPSRTVTETAYRNQTASDQSNLIRQVSTTRGEDSSVRQTVFLQQSGIVAPNLPNGNYNLPPDAASGGSSASGSLALPPNLPATPPVVSSVPSGSLGPTVLSPPPNASLPSNPPGFRPPAVSSSVLTPGASDYAPLAQPQLQNGFATIDNCNCISEPSTYSAASGIGCGVAPCGYAAPAPCAVPQAYAAPPPAQIGPQVIAPQVIGPGEFGPLAAPTVASAAPVPSLITLGQQRLPVEVGQGLWGQPVAYVPDQGIRNWVRYFFP